MGEEGGGATVKEVTVFPSRLLSQTPAQLLPMLETTIRCISVVQTRINLVKSPLKISETVRIIFTDQGKIGTTFFEIFRIYFSQ